MELKADVFGAFEPPPSVSDANLPKSEKTPSRILELCKKHEEEGVIIVGIGALTPLADAVALDKQGNGILRRAVKKIYLQGHVNSSPSTTSTQLTTQNQLTPGIDAFNYFVDYDAALQVFRYFHDHVPLTTMGKFAAYRVKVLKKDLLDWSSYLHPRLGSQMPDPERLYSLSKIGLIDLREHKSVAFKNAHPAAPQTGKDTALETWFDSQSSEYGLAAAYDPLLALALVLDLRRETGHLSENMDDLLQKEAVKFTTASGTEITHHIFGNTSEKHSVSDSDLVHKVLKENIERGLLRLPSKEKAFL